MSVEGDVDDLREQLEQLQDKQRQLLLQQEQVNNYMFVCACHSIKWFVF